MNTGHTNQMFSDVWHFWPLWPGERQEATRDQGRWAGTSEERPGDPGALHGWRKAQAFNVERCGMIWFFFGEYFGEVNEMSKLPNAMWISCISLFWLSVCSR